MYVRLLLLPPLPPISRHWNQSNDSHVHKPETVLFLYINYVSIVFLFQTYYLLRICAYSFPAFCQEYLARNPGYYVVPMKVNGSAVKSLFSQFKYASGGKLLSANYETAKRSVMIRKNIHGPRVAKGYRDQPIFTHAVPLPGPKKKRK